MTYVLSDIHGNLRRFESIMKQINLQSDDTLYVLGDVVDRYPDGIKILRRITKMPNARMLMGNHEYMMLQAIGHCRNAADERVNTNWKQRRHWYQNGGRVTHEQLKHIRLDARAEIFRFIRQLPVNMEVTVNGIKYKLVHASPVENYMSSYWYSRDYKDQRELLLSLLHKQGNSGKMITDSLLANGTIHKIRIHFQIITLTEVGISAGIMYNVVKVFLNFCTSPRSSA